MRCRPGELGIIDTPAHNGACQCFVGMPFALYKGYEDSHGDFHWKVPPFLACQHYAHVARHLQSVPDSMMRPIRPYLPA